MNRKQFIKTSGIGLGLTLLPGIVQGQTSNNNFNFEGIEPKIIRDADGKVLNVIGDIQTHKLVGKKQIIKL